MIKVKDIRKDITVVSEKCGLYEWWFLESDAIALLKGKCGVDCSRINTMDIDGKTYWALYFGQAKKESLRERINWHINQKHSASTVESGYLSTLRATLSALIGIDESKSEDEVNKIMDNAIIELTPMEASEIDAAEYKAINSGYYPLNIQGNNSVDKDFLRELTKLRKEHKK